MMKRPITVFILTVIYACQNPQKTESANSLNDNLMVGEWRIDSASKGHFSRDKLILLEDGRFYAFSGSDGGSMLMKGQKLDGNLLASDLGDTMKINLLDSNKLYISGGWNNNEYFYKRSDNNNYRDNLKAYIQSDALRKKVIGWWKLTSSKMQVKLINHHGYYEKFTLNMRDDGQAVFYLENHLDSTVNYSYHVNPDGIDFDRGCIRGSDCKVSFDQSGKMKLVLDKTMGDTLILEKLTQIK